MYVYMYVHIQLFVEAIDHISVEYDTFSKFYVNLFDLWKMEIRVSKIV